MEKPLYHVQKLTFSGLMIALYVTVLYLTQSFSFGAYQIRIATSLYALAYLFPFLVVPLGLANAIGNIFGGLGILDLVGGFAAGLATTGLEVLIRRANLPLWLCALPILLVPGLGVPIWLSYLLELPYWPLALSLVIGQIVPAICGVGLIHLCKRVWAAPGKERRQA